MASYAIYIFVFIAQFGGAIGGLAYSDTIADVIPMSRAVEVFGKVNAYTLSSSVAGLSIATAIFLFLNVREAYRVIYVISLITAVISAGVLYLVTDLVRRESIKLSLKQFYKKASGVISNAAVKHYTMFVSLFTFFVNIPGALWNYYIIKVFGGTEMWISLNTISSSLANAIGNYVFWKSFK